MTLEMALEDENGNELTTKKMINQKKYRLFLDGEFIGYIDFKHLYEMNSKYKNFFRFTERAKEDYEFLSKKYKEISVS